MDTTNESASHDGDGGVHSTNANTTESASRNEVGDDAHHPFECYICYNPATEPVLTKCGHLYCWPCLYKWARTAETCAVCRATVNEFNIICLQTPSWSTEEDSAAKADENSGIPPRPQPSPPEVSKAVRPIVHAINRDSDEKIEGRDRLDVDQVASTYRRRWELIGDLVYSMQLQYEMIQPHDQNINAVPPLLDARLANDFREFKAGRSVPDAQRPYVIMMKERVKAILRRHDDERQRVSDNFDIVQSEQREQSAQSHAQEEDTASSQHAEISLRYGQEEEEETASSQHQEIAQRHGQEEEEGASYPQEEATHRRGEEQVKIDQQLARIRSALQAAGLDLQLDFGAMEGEQIAERNEEVGDAASSTDQ